MPEGWNGQWVSLWAERWPMFTAFALSFAIIGVFWNTHRRVFARMTGFSNGGMLFNMLALAGGGLMPFATTLLYEQPRKAQTCRGVTYWQAASPQAGVACEKRIFKPDRYGNVYAIDADTGKTQWIFYSTPPAGVNEPKSGGATGGQITFNGATTGSSTLNVAAAAGNEDDD